MNKIQVKQVLEYLELNYPNFKVSKEMFDMWLDGLQEYDYEDVINKTKELMSTGHYSNNPPHLVTITNNLTKVDNKIDWKKQVVLCKNCNKGFNVDKNGYSADLKEHEDRCGSINYVIKQMKRWYGVKMTRRELWALPKEEFDAKYDKLLHYIYEHTTNQAEKDVIGYIWNPPSQDVARKFFGIREEEE